MTPTGSWPMTRPWRTGYSPLTMWTSVPQMVVVVTPDDRLAGTSVGPRDLLEADVARAVEHGGAHGVRRARRRRGGMGKHGHVGLRAQRSEVRPLREGADGRGRPDGTPTGRGIRWRHIRDLGPQGAGQQRMTPLICSSIPGVVNSICRYDCLFSHGRLDTDRPEALLDRGGSIHRQRGCVLPFATSPRGVDAVPRRTSAPSLAPTATSTSPRSRWGRTTFRRRRRCSRQTPGPVRRSSSRTAPASLTGSI